MSNLTNAKIGDKIACRSEYSTRDNIFVVERKTKTLVVCNHGRSFRIDTGLLQGTGDTYWRCYGRIVTDAEVEAMTEETRLAARIRAAKQALSVCRVTGKNIEAVEAMLAACEKVAP